MVVWRFSAAFAALKTASMRLSGQALCLNGSAQLFCRSAGQGAGPFRKFKSALERDVLYYLVPYVAGVRVYAA